MLSIIIKTFIIACWVREIKGFMSEPGGTIGRSQDKVAKRVPELD